MSVEVAKLTEYYDGRIGYFSYMNPGEARDKIKSLGLEYSQDNFLKYVQSGDHELVELFLDAGMPSDVRDANRSPAILVAQQAGQVDIARLLLARGASPEPLLSRPPQGKDKWDKLSASSAVLSFISGILIAAVGGYFTYSYNQRQIELNRAQLERDASTKDQANKVLELEAVTKLIPTLSSSDETGKAAAFIAIQDLAHPELAAHLALYFKGKGAVDYLQQAASSGSPKAKEVAVQALSSLAAHPSQPDSKLASRALSNVFDSTKQSVVLITAISRDSDTSISGSGVVVSADGFVLTSAHLVAHSSPATLQVRRYGGRISKAQVVNLDLPSYLAILKVEGVGFVPVRLAAEPVQLGSPVIGIGYAGGESSESAFVGLVTSIDDYYIYFNALTVGGAAGGPLLGDTGEVVGVIYGGNDKVSLATRGDIALTFLKKQGITSLK